jgi:hypothetical protein
MTNRARRAVARHDSSSLCVPAKLPLSLNATFTVLRKDEIAPSTWRTYSIFCACL